MIMHVATKKATKIKKIKKVLKKPKLIKKLWYSMGIKEV
jgi:hypothetical protein